jgi:glutathione peroxidase
LDSPAISSGHRSPAREEIGAFCQKNYGVSFPMFEKVDVNGDTTHPLYQWLKHSAPGLLGTEKIKWNFTKFLIDRSGKVIARFAPVTKPDDIEKDVAKLL